MRSLMQARASTRLDLRRVEVRPRLEIARARESTITFIEGRGLSAANDLRF